VHGMLFKKPIKNGQVIRLESKVVLASRSRLVSYVKIMDNTSDEMYLDGFLSFVHVDLQGKAMPHGIVLNHMDPEDVALLEKAKNLK
jgi:acyl-CoA hydrolase